MEFLRLKLVRYVLIALAIGIFTAILSTRRDKDTSHPRDYDEIAASGVLRAVVEYNSFSYHVSGDTVEGFDYQLLQAFASAHGLQLEVTPEMSYEKRLQGIWSGHYDILGSGTAITVQSRDSLLFTTPLQRSKQVLVQRRVEEVGDSLFVSSVLSLSGRTVHLIKGSNARLRMSNIMHEIADTIYVAEVEDYGAEQLMAMVAGGDIDYAVCDESLALGVIEHFPTLDISTEIGFTQLFAWGVSKRSPALLDSLNGFLSKLRIKN